MDEENEDLLLALYFFQRRLLGFGTMYQGTESWFTIVTLWRREKEQSSGSVNTPEYLTGQLGILLCLSVVPLLLFLTSFIGIHS